MSNEIDENCVAIHQKNMEQNDNSFMEEFLNHEKQCLVDLDSTISDLDVDSIFEEINRLSNNDDNRSVDEILREAEILIRKQPIFTSENENLRTISCESTPMDMRNGVIDIVETTPLVEERKDKSKELWIAASAEKCDETVTLNEMKTKRLAKSPKKVEQKRKFSLKNVENKEKNNETLFSTSGKIFCDKSTAPSPTHTISPAPSPSSWEKERELESRITTLQEKLKDTEERYESLKIQYESLSHVHRALRENHGVIQEESDKLKLDVQHLNECANVLRNELQSARSDRDAALELQKILQCELEESRKDKKKFQELNEKDAKTIQDLHRQCREMERILMRKHPDSVSALIVASKNTSNKSGDNSTRRILEQRIAQLESDAKEQDLKAQGILANVQARFNSVQSKYETHIADLETQVLSLQEINSKLNEKIIRQIDELYNAKEKRNLITNFTQTDDIPEKECIKTRSILVQTDSKMATAVATKNPPKKNVTSGKLSNSYSDTSIQNKEDAHLLATIRGMRVDLAIKEKAVLRLTREVDDCKKTIKKLQKERDAYLKPESGKSSSTSSKKSYDPLHYSESNVGDTGALKDALSKIKHMENDYRALHDKRLQDLKTLQSAHERELAACHETVRILQQRLAEREDHIKEKRRPNHNIDYYALKAKVTSLERRHTEREQRLHMLVEALSKGGKLNGVHYRPGDEENQNSNTSSSCQSPINGNL